MREVIRLVQDIRSFLAGAPGSPPAEALASPYVRWRQEVANRLESCATMLEKGSEYQVLQFAETDPPLMDLVAQLAFAEEPQWVDYCRQYQLPTPARLDSRTLQALNEIYSKGITPNSQLYRDYRAAVTSRDEDKALEIMRSIVRLNPADANATLELGRWRNKKMLARLEDLKAAITIDDRDAVAALTDEVEALGTEEKLSRNELYLEGASIRDSLLRERAALEAVALLNHAEELKQEGNWREISVSSARFRALEREHALPFSQEQQHRILALERFVEKRRADAAVQQDFDKALAALRAFADKVDTRLLTATTLTLEESQKLESTFADFWKRVERFQLPVPEGELARLQGIGEAVRREAARKRGAKRTVKMAMAGVCFALLSAAAWTGYASWRAYDYVGQLTDFQSRRLAAATAKLVEAIPGSAPWGATSIPALRAALEDKRQWAKGEIDHLGMAERQLDELERLEPGNFAGVTPGNLHAKLEATTQAVQGLCADLAAGPMDRLSQLQNKADQRFTGLRTAIAEDTQKHLASLTKLVQGLNFGKPVAELADTLASIDDIIKQLAKIRKPDAPELRLPADIDVSAQKLQSQAEVYAKEMAALSKSKQEMSDAGKLEAYKLALTGYSKLRFTEVGSAARVLADFPTPDSFGAKLCFGGDQGQWELAKKEARTGWKFYPEDVTESELRKVMKLRDDPELNIHAPVNAKTLLDAMLLSSLTDASGEHYQKPLLGTIDSLVRSPQGDPIVKAYLALHMYGVMTTRGDSWGLSHCPQLVQDMAGIKSIFGSYNLRSGDWSLPKVHDKYAMELKKSFDKMAQNKTYLEQARTHLSWVSAVLISTGYIGHVDASHGLNLKPGGVSLIKVWGLAEGSGAPIAVTLTDGAASKEETSKLRKWSPLFTLPPNPGT